MEVVWQPLQGLKLWKRVKKPFPQSKKDISNCETTTTPVKSFGKPRALNFLAVMKKSDPAGKMMPSNNIWIKIWINSVFPNPLPQKIELHDPNLSARITEKAHTILRMAMEAMETVDDQV